MDRFSVRNGFAPEPPVQSKDMNQGLRTGIWNTLHACMERQEMIELGFGRGELEFWLTRAWVDFLKQPVDSLVRVHALITVRGTLRQHILKDFKWYEVYEFIEYFVATFPNLTESFADALNSVLAQERSAYRLIGSVIAPVTNETEAQEVQRASSVLGPIGAHIEDATRLLRDDQGYRNSIKESISAVEAACRLIVGDQGLILSKALNRLEDSGVSLHTTLKAAFEKLYAWTNDAEGIRHALKEAPTLGLEDARFMLVACSAFVNYLIEKARKAGIEFKNAE